MAPYSVYGNKLKAYRKHLGLSVAQFAGRLGVSRATQANYEAGRTVPDLAYADRCVSLGISPDSLLCSVESNKLDSSAVPVELHRIIEQHAVELRKGGPTTPMYEALWRLFIGSASDAGSAEPVARASTTAQAGPARRGRRKGSP